MNHVQSLIDQAAQTIESLRSLENQITQAADVVRTCMTQGGKILACGNGGSGGDAADFTTEYICRFQGDRKPFPAINLTADGTALTAIANDYSFEEIFSRQVRGFGKPGDVLIGITTSGQSKNVIRALEAANEIGLKSIALLGKDGGKAKGLATVDIIVPVQVTARIQEAHKFILHTICELVDPALKAI
jgi:D-sedoheptulose 7-phosphate isomerase